MDVFELFPTPIAHIKSVFDDGELNQIKDLALSKANTPNKNSSNLFHSSPADKDAKKLLAITKPKLRQIIIDFGELLLGDVLEWKIKEIWSNVSEKGGHQHVHNHANSFISGIIYISKAHESSRTVFHRQIGHNTFTFTHASETSVVNQFNAELWTIPNAESGDVLLFPSYLYHEVPTNKGTTRISVAFNAIPREIRSHDYSVRLE